MIDKINLSTEPLPTCDETLAELVKLNNAGAESFTLDENSLIIHWDSIPEHVKKRANDRLRNCMPSSRSCYGKPEFSIINEVIMQGEDEEIRPRLGIVYRFGNGINAEKLSESFTLAQMNDRCCFNDEVKAEMLVSYHPLQPLVHWLLSMSPMVSWFVDIVSECFRISEKNMFWEDAYEGETARLRKEAVCMKPADDAY